MKKQHLRDRIQALTGEKPNETSSLMKLAFQLARVLIALFFAFRKRP